VKKIASFTVDHTLLKPGIYISRTDGDITTYDLRFAQPNTPPFLSDVSLHTTEHLFATLARNSIYGDKVIYFGPMGCKTGYYFIVRDMKPEEVIALVQIIMLQICDFAGPIPGASEKECGNWLLLDLAAAKADAEKYSENIKNYTAKQLCYL